MKLTEKEIRGQFVALKQTLAEVEACKGKIASFFKGDPPKSITFLGCGSSYSVAKSLAVMGNMLLDIPCFAMAAGDLWLNFARYKKQLSGGALVGISRSGATSELINAFKAADGTCKKYMSINCSENSLLSRQTDLDIVLPWAFDESVCQTSCVTNMYSAGVVIIATLAGRTDLIQDLAKAAQIGGEFIERHEGSLRKHAAADWDHVVVLADAELGGLADEASLAFKEVCQLPSNYYNILDYRHGPIVLCNEKTLVVVMPTHDNSPVERALIADVVRKGGYVVTLSPMPQPDVEGVRLNVSVGSPLQHAAAGLMHICACQLLAYFKSFIVGCDPDAPKDLRAWIKI